MKKTLLIIALSASSYFSMFADVTVSDILGSYKGKLEVFVQDNETNDIDKMSEKEDVEVFTVDPNQNSFTFLLEDFSLLVGGVEMTVGDIRVPEVEIGTNGEITKGFVNLDKTAVGLGYLPTTITGTMLKESTALNIQVLWDVLGGTTAVGSPTTMNIAVTFNGNKVVNNPNSLTQIESDVIIANYGNSIEVVGANLLNYSIYNIQGKLLNAA